MTQLHGHTRHAHYWVIDPPAGKDSMETCLTCGARQQFENFSRTPFVNRWVETKGK